METVNNVPESNVEVVNKVETTPEVTVAAKEETLLSRVSSFKKEPATTTTDAEKLGLTREDWDKVQSDPSLKKYYQSMLTDYQKKTSEIAEQRRQFEARSKAESNWTVDRVNGLLKDPNFIEAAKQVAQIQNPSDSGLTDTEWSAFSDAEKARFKQLEQRQIATEQLLLSERKAKEDVALKAKYADYAPDIVDTTVSNLLNGKQQATREDIWKVINHDSNVQRAYELGKVDGQAILKDKVASTSTDGFNTQSVERIEPEKGEKDLSFFRRIVYNNLAKNKK